MFRKWWVCQLLSFRKFKQYTYTHTHTHTHTYTHTHTHTHTHPHTHTHHLATVLAVKCPADTVVMTNETQEGREQGNTTKRKIQKEGNLENLRDRNSEKGEAKAKQSKARDQNQAKWIQNQKITRMQRENYRENNKTIHKKTTGMQTNRLECSGSGWFAN